MGGVRKARQMNPLIEKVARAPTDDLAGLATMLRRSIYNAYRATLVGTPALVTARYQERSRFPVVGDLVIEASTVYRSRGTADLDSVGILEEDCQEKVIFDSDPEFVWDEDVEGEPHPTERVFYIRTLDGRRFRWTNATMVAAVSDLNALEA